MNECRFETDKKKHLILLPGMLSPVFPFFPLVWHMRHAQTEYGVTAVPLGLSLADFDSVVERAARTIERGLMLNQPQRIILFGHSHGGRIACALMPHLKQSFPSTEFSVVTAGTPMTKRPNYLPWYLGLPFRLSRAFRDWPAVTQPNPNTVQQYIGYYSTNDTVVIPEFAKAGFTGELIELESLSHHDLILPAHIGALLLEHLKV